MATNAKWTRLDAKVIADEKASGALQWLAANAQRQAEYHREQEAFHAAERAYWDELAKSLGGSSGGAAPSSSPSAAPQLKASTSATSLAAPADSRPRGGSVAALGAGLQFRLPGMGAPKKAAVTASPSPSSTTAPATTPTSGDEEENRGRTDSVASPIEHLTLGRPSVARKPSRARTQQAFVASNAFGQAVSKPTFKPMVVIDGPDPLAPLTGDEPPNDGPTTPPAGAPDTLADDKPADVTVTPSTDDATPAAAAAVAAEPSNDIAAATPSSDEPKKEEEPKAAPKRIQLPAFTRAPSTSTGAPAKAAPVKFGLPAKKDPAATPPPAVAATPPTEEASKDDTPAVADTPAPSSSPSQSDTPLSAAVADDDDQPVDKLPETVSERMARMAASSGPGLGGMGMMGMLAGVKLKPSAKKADTPAATPAAAGAPPPVAQLTRGASQTSVTSPSKIATPAKTPAKIPVKVAAKVAESPKSDATTPLAAPVAAKAAPGKVALPPAIAKKPGTPAPADEPSSPSPASSDAPKVEAKKAINPAFAAARAAAAAAKDTPPAAERPAPKRIVTGAAGGIGALAGGLAAVLGGKGPAPVSSPATSSDDATADPAAAETPVAAVASTPVAATPPTPVKRPALPKPAVASANYIRAQFDCPPPAEGQDSLLQFIKDEVLTLITDADKDWWHASNKAGKAGYVPAAFFAKLTNDEALAHEGVAKTPVAGTPAGGGVAAAQAAAAKVAAKKAESDAKAAAAKQAAEQKAKAEAEAKAAAAAAAAASAAAAAAAVVPAAGAPPTGGKTALALYDYDAVAAGAGDQSVSFKKGDTLIITPGVGDDQWLYATLAGKSGYIPANYVKVN